MTVSVSTVEASNPDALTSAANSLGGKIAALDASLDERRRIVGNLRESWQGTAADAAIRKAEQGINRQEEMRARLVTVRNALSSGGQNMDSARDALLKVVGGLRATGWDVGDDGTASPPPVPTFAKLFAPAFTAMIKRLLNLFDTADQQTAEAIRAALNGPMPEMPAGTLGDARKLPADGTSPEDVKKWWDSLSRDEQRSLLDQHPAELGNMNGIPATARDEVNRAVMQDDLDRVTDVAQRYGVSADDVTGNPGAYGLTAQDVTRYSNAVKTQKGLETTAGGERPDGTTNRPVMLWAYDPLAFGGQGAGAIAIGNPDVANDTAVVVPGTGSSVKDGWFEGDNATNLYDQMLQANPGEKTSVIAWMGYDAPDSPTDPRIATPGLARSGGDLLAADVNGLSATHDGSASHVTMVGHSYGATTVADAFAGSGMHANDAVLIGSPGTDLANNAGDFHLPEGGNVYVGAASSDPVSWLGQAGPLPDIINRELNFPLGLEAGLGRDPAGDGFGSVRFDAEAVGRDGLDFADHSKYYTPGSESLRSITDIASGNAATLDDNGLLADGRQQIHVGLPHEIDLPGLPPIDLPDWDVRVPGTPAFNDPEGDRGQGSISNDHGY